MLTVFVFVVFVVCLFLFVFVVYRVRNCCCSGVFEICVVRNCCSKKKCCSPLLLFEECVRKLCSKLLVEIVGRKLLVGNCCSKLLFETKLVQRMHTDGKKQGCTAGIYA